MRPSPPMSPRTRTHGGTGATAGGLTHPPSPPRVPADWARAVTFCAAVLAFRLMHRLAAAALVPQTDPSQSRSTKDLLSSEAAAGVRPNPHWLTEAVRWHCGGEAGFFHFPCPRPFRSMHRFAAAPDPDEQLRHLDRAMLGELPAICGERVLELV